MSTKKDINIRQSIELINSKEDEPKICSKKELENEFSLENDIKNEKSKIILCKKSLGNTENTNEEKRNNNSNIKLISHNKNSLKRDKKKEPFGFPNIGHSCYMNSFLQILLNTPHFLENLKICSKESPNHPLIDHLIQLSNFPDVRSLIEIKRIMAEEDERFGKYAQNDSQEFGIKLINKIIMILKGKESFSEEENYDDEEINLLKNKNYKKDKFNQYINNYCKKENETLLEKMFQFHEIIYNIDINEKEVGKYKKIDFNSFINIDLVFPNNNDKFNLFKTYNLYDLLKDKYLKIPKFNITDNSFQKIMDIWEKFLNYLKKILNITSEENDLDYTTIKINNIVYNNLYSLPKILIISINRAFHGQYVNRSKLIFEEILDLKDFLDPDASPNEDTTYKLYGINECYRGLFDFGHCYSFVKINNEWYKLDDNKKVAIKEKLEFNSNHVVGLYYIKENINPEESFFSSI